MPWQKLDAVSDGTTLVAAPPTGQFIRVIGLNFSSPSAIVTVTLKSNSTVIWETKNMGASPFGERVPTDPNNTIDCVPGDPLVLGASGGAVSGGLEYVIYGKPPS